MRKKTINPTQVNYYKSSTSSPETWIKRAVKELKTVDATDIMYGINDTGRSFHIAFNLDGQPHRISWTALTGTKKTQETALLRQAATAMYHDVKSKCVAAKFKSALSAFSSERLLASGMTVEQALSSPEHPQGLLLLQPPPSTRNG